MTRQEFMARLARGLHSLPMQTVADILSDYEIHFEEARAAGRQEAEVVEAMGDPGRLARELRAQIGLKRWEQDRTPSAAAGAILAVVGLGMLDLMILGPLLLSIACTLFSLALSAFIILLVGVYVMVAGPFTGPPGGPATAILIGLGLMAGSVAVGAILWLISLGLVHVTVWYGRLHIRLLRPALEAHVVIAPKELTA